MVKLALSGLDGVETTKVWIGGAMVLYDPEILTADQLVNTVNKKTQFEASLKTDGEFDQKEFDKRNKKCGWFRFSC